MGGVFYLTQFTFSFRQLLVVRHFLHPRGNLSAECLDQLLDRCRPTRKPILLFRLSVVFLLRLAERRFCGLLFQERARTKNGDVGRAS